MNLDVYYRGDRFDIRDLSNISYVFFFYYL